jgi:hypothetical protein
MDKTAMKSELDKLLSEFSTWDDERREHEEARGLVKSSLHHYCDMASLIGMVQNNQLWLTSIAHLNDPSELIHGRDLASSHFFDIISAEPSSNVDSFCGMMMQSMEAAYDTAFNLFVASFSQTPNDLAQWRAYADDGRGVAIEVSPAWFKPDPSKARFVPGQSDPRDYYAVSNVVYNEDTARSRQSEAIDRAIDLIKDAEKRNLLVDGPLNNYFLASLRASLGVPLLWNSITTKHEAYKHEAETRLLLTHEVSTLGPYVRTRARGSQIVSYVPIEFPISTPGVLKRIWIGPAAIGDPERGVADLLRAKGIDPNGLIEFSKIPYRPR